MTCLEQIRADRATRKLNNTRIDRDAAHNPTKLKEARSKMRAIRERLSNLQAAGTSA